MTRNQRNNNPGNLRKTNATWEGEVAGDDPEFEAFDTAASGFRALAKILVRYQEEYGLDTVTLIINRYAPASENNTDAYIRHVAAKLKVDPDAALPRFRDNPTILTDLCMAIAKHEGGEWARDTAVQGVNRAVQATLKA